MIMAVCDICRENLIKNEYFISIDEWGELNSYKNLNNVNNKHYLLCFRCVERIFSIYRAYKNETDTKD